MEPVTEEARSITRNRRTDAMFVAAYVAVVALVYVVIYEDKIGEFGQGVVTLVLGMFLNELKNMYSYETGTTRASQTKDETIKGMAAAAPVQIARAVASARSEPLPPVAANTATPAPEMANGTVPAASAVEVQPKEKP